MTWDRQESDKEDRAHGHELKEAKRRLDAEKNLQELIRREENIWILWSDAVGGWRVRLIRRIWPELGVALDDIHGGAVRRLAQSEFMKNLARQKELRR